MFIWMFDEFDKGNTLNQLLSWTENQNQVMNSLWRFQAKILQQILNWNKIVVRECHKKLDIENRIFKGTFANGLYQC